MTKAEMRLELPPLEEMTPAQRQLYDQSIAFFGTPTGPRLPLMLNPELAKNWAGLLAAIKSGQLSDRLAEMTILVVARFWRCEFEWWAHEKAAAKAGLTADQIDALRLGNLPELDSAEDQAVYRYVHQLLYDKRVDAEVYDQVNRAIGPKALVELTALAGHYGTVAAMLNALEVKIPGGVQIAFES